MCRFGLACLLLLASTVLADDKPAVKEPALRTEILRRTKIDQDAREKLVKLMNGQSKDGQSNADMVKLVHQMEEIDVDNTKWLLGVIDKHGWPTIEMVGTDGSSSAWLLVQHADKDVKFQRRCLDLMTKLPKEAISQKNVAYLTDRVLLAEGKKQLYGTQFATINGKLGPRPLEDEANVDKRRAEVGLGTMAEYAKVIEKQYGGGKK